MDRGANLTRLPFFVRFALKNLLLPDRTSTCTQKENQDGC